MGGLIVQVMVPVLLTNGFRWFGRCLGPRRGALLMGLPTTTAVVLYGYGIDRGATEAFGAAEACLLGLVAAAIMPIWYARAAGNGGGLPHASLLAIFGYAGVAALLRGFAGGAGGPSILLGFGGVGLAVVLASRGAAWSLRSGPEELVAPALWRSRTHWGLIATRTAVPAIMGLGARLVREAGGPSAAGLLLSFPATSLALLVTTHVESGPAAACRLARSLPMGAFGMAAYLSAYLGLVGAFGPLVATVVGYGAALGALGVVEGVATGRLFARTVRKGASVGRLARQRFGRYRLALAEEVRAERRGPHRASRAGRRSRFSPCMEALAG